MIPTASFIADFWTEQISGEHRDGIFLVLVGFILSFAFIRTTRTNDIRFSLARIVGLLGWLDGQPVTGLVIEPTPSISIVISSPG